MVVASVLTLLPWLGLAYAAIITWPPGTKTTLSCDQGELGCLYTDTAGEAIARWVWPAAGCVIFAVAIAIAVARTHRARVWPAAIVVGASSALGFYIWYLS
jgi:hypothetical protein